MNTHFEKPIAPVAVIDVGASAIRMEIAELHPDGSVRQLEALSRGVQLGKDTFTAGRLSSESIQAACEVLRGFKQVMDSYGVGRYRAVTTSAVREADNSDTFLDRVFLRTGLDVDIIEGPEENRLTYAAVRDAFAHTPDLASHDCLMVEVGGGSADISFLQDWEPLHSGTYPLGSIRMRQAAEGISGDYGRRLRLMRQNVANVIAHVTRDMPLRRVRYVIMLGGDVRFVAKRLCDSEGSPAIPVVARQAFLDFCDEVVVHDIEALVSHYRMSYADAETLGPALLAYQALLDACPAEEVFIPNVSIRAGVLLDLARAEAGLRPRRFGQEIRISALTLGRKYQFDEPHARQVSHLATHLFDLLQKEHGMGPSERVLLEVAALLHDIGLFVSARAHHKHTQYLLAASHIFGLTRRDVQLAANVARYHRRSPPQRRHPDYASLDRDSRVIVCKLAAILRVANALDREHDQKIKDVELAPEEGRWVILAETDADISSERMGVSAKGNLFSDTFGQPVVLRKLGATR